MSLHIKNGRVIDLATGDCRRTLGGRRKIFALKAAKRKTIDAKGRGGGSGFIDLFGGCASPARNTRRSSNRKWRPDVGGPASPVLRTPTRRRRPGLVALVRQRQGARGRVLRDPTGALTVKSRARR
jgi:hypothetical protein